MSICKHEIYITNTGKPIVKKKKRRMKLKDRGSLHCVFNIKLLLCFVSVRGTIGQEEQQCRDIIVNVEDYINIQFRAQSIVVVVDVVVVFLHGWTFVECPICMCST